MATIDYREPSWQAVWSPRILSVLRIAAALLFMQHGLQKWFGVPPPQQAMPPFDLFSKVGISGTIELYGGVLLLIGLGTRLVSFLMSGEMAVAYFMVHAPQDWWPLTNKGELAALYCFVFFYFVFAGGGTWSIDNLLRRTETVPESSTTAAPYRMKYEERKVPEEHSH